MGSGRKPLRGRRGRTGLPHSTDGSGADLIAHLPGRFLLGVTAHPDGSLLLCDSTAGEVVRLDLETRIATVWTAAASGQRLRCPNYLSLLPDGSAILTDSGDIDVPNGSLVHVPATGGDGVRLPIGPMFYPNGCALLDDGGRDGAGVVVVESMLPGLVVIRGDRREVLVELPGTVPDGVAVAEDGTLIVGCFQPNRLLHVDPAAGSFSILDDDWTGQRLLTPTNVTFFGPRLDQLAVASVGGWSVLAMAAPCVGRRLPGSHVTRAAS